MSRESEEEVACLLRVVDASGSAGSKYGTACKDTYFSLPEETQIVVRSHMMVAHFESDASQVGRLAAVLRCTCKDEYSSH